MNGFVITALLASAITAGTAPCRITSETVAKNAVVDRSNTAPAACPDTPAEPKLRFDRRAGVARARVALDDGEAIGRPFLPEPPPILPGDRVLITARLGHVTVSRPATALQSARLGQSFFARGDDGRIFAAPRLKGDGE